MTVVDSRPQDQSGSYQGAAEFHDLFMVEPWERLRVHVRTAFAQLGPAATILDLGAGTGMGTRVIAAESSASISAIEPSRIMRTALILGVASDAGLSERVTVIAGAAPTAVEQYDGQIDGFVCAHLLGHLDDDERARTFAALRSLMSPQAVGLITTPPDTKPDPDQVAARLEHRRIGRYDYSARYRREPDGEGFVVEYRVARADTVLRVETYPEAWALPPRNELVAEIDDAGLVLEQAGPDVGIVRRRP